VYEVALANVNASGVERVLVVAAAVLVIVVSDTVFATAAAIGSRGVEGVSTGFLNDISALMVVAYQLAFDAVVGVFMDIAVNLCLL